MKRLRRASQKRAVVELDTDSSSEEDDTDDVEYVLPEQVASRSNKRPRILSSSESEGGSGSESEHVTATKTAAVKANGSGASSALASRAQLSDFRSLELKRDHQVRPLWVCPDGRIFLEAFSRFYVPARDFLVQIAEPVSRPSLLHEYMLTSYSLLAAVAAGMETSTIVEVLDRLSKVPLPHNVRKFIKECTLGYGNVKIVLRQKRFFVESPYKRVLHKLLQNDVIKHARLAPASVAPSASLASAPSAPSAVIPLQVTEAAIEHASAKERASLEEHLRHMDEAEADDDEREGAIPFDAGVAKSPTTAAVAATETVVVDCGPVQVLSFEVKSAEVEPVRRAAHELGCPLLEEYDFRRDAANAAIPIELKHSTTIRPYQERCLNKMFGNGRARSGVVVLPCGAGTLVLCTSSVAVEQWKRQFHAFANVGEDRVCRFTSRHKEAPHAAGCIVLTTYSMMAAGGRRSEDATSMLRTIGRREWGLLLLDEVHVVPARLFRRVLTRVKAHSKLGLTATLVREDDLISDLRYLIGPKLYEANWLDLTRGGYLANVQCSEVWCPMTAAFFAEYIQSLHGGVGLDIGDHGDKGVGSNVARSGHGLRQLLAVLNPNKVLACAYLVRYHESRGDKTLVFCDDIEALHIFAEKLGRPTIFGSTSEKDRMRLLGQFTRGASLNTLVISKVGDVALDLPEATVIVQVASHYGSRRQEAQRLGRILRPKRGMCYNAGEHNAFFYSLVSTRTHEMAYATRRQQYLIDQGYAYKVVTNLDETARADVGGGGGNEGAATLVNLEEQLRLLKRVLLLKDRPDIGSVATNGSTQEVEPTAHTSKHAAEAPATLALPVPARRKRGSLAALSGAGDMTYLEFSSADAKAAKLASTPPRPAEAATVGFRPSRLLAGQQRRAVAHIGNYNEGDRDGDGVAVREAVNMDDSNSSSTRPLDN